MNDLTPMPNTEVPSDLSDDALDWQVRLHSGQATAAERLEYLRWRQASPAHAAAAEEAEQLWGDIGDTRAANTLSLPVPPRKRRPRAALAASLVLALAAYTGWQQAPMLFADYHTATGAQQTITLSDGSRVTLNSASAVSVDYSAGQRKVLLKAGEALFEPAQDERPFIVESAGEQVQGSGAVFSVRQSERGNRVVVSQGQARLGDRVVTQSPDAAALTAWQRGKLIFNGKPLRDVIAELERYQHGRILISDSQLGALPVSGVFDLNDPHGLLRSLEQRYGLKVTYLPLLAVLH